jgi:hypothetical protein
MIRYALKCGEGHGFESWFASASAYDRLEASGHLSCPVCGGSKVEKALMAPALSASGPQMPAQAPQAADVAVPDLPPGLAPGDDVAALARQIEALRREVEGKSDYVGMEFAARARAMHLGDEPERPIYGEARPDEARALIEEGVPVAPLPFIPRARSN